jgi:hypothetical protein
VDGCGDVTREGKPYCTEHVEQHTYVRRILADLARSEDEEAEVRARGAEAVDTDGLLAEEVVRTLQLNGSRTVERLARDTQLAPPVVASYVEALEGIGMVTCSRTRRGATLVHLERTTPRRRSLSNRLPAMRGGSEETRPLQEAS